MSTIMKKQRSLIADFVRPLGFQVEMIQNKRTLENLVRREEPLCLTEACNR